MNRKLPEYANPPIAEVVIGAQFQTINDMMAPHLWKIWERFGKDNFPGIEERENLAKIGSKPGFVFNYPNYELPRHWFVNHDESLLIQLQRDRFIFNWRKLDNCPSEYHRYHNIKEDFYKYFADFDFALQDLKLIPPTVEMLELTYINLIPMSVIDNSLSKISLAFKDTGWSEKKLLPSPQGMNLMWWFELADIDAKMQINIISALGIGDGELKLRMELSVRGKAPHADITKCKDWFDYSHNHIVSSFDDMTTTHMHNLWGKK